jgi:hypothetical protein
LSPGRALLPADYEYDDVDNMAHWLGSPERPLAIHTHGHGGPPTKKKDLEKGRTARTDECGCSWRWTVILLLANMWDLTVDFVVDELRTRQHPFLRLKHRGVTKWLSRDLV